ncbi:MAG TPA: three-Cys-motif partner protein TcmP [Fimbriimonadales bacterium]|nr:three-Cys-motif partner protein TcmP [Fimbriimonadales bacterium]
MTFQVSEPPSAEYGGNWTRDKLDRLKRYLHPYQQILKGEKYGNFFNTIYVDAFAGCGKVYIKKGNVTEQSDFEEFHEPETKEFVEGSAKIALGIDPPFDEYIFIDKSKQRTKELKQLLENYGRGGQVINQDANSWLQNWCDSTDWNRTRAVVFLDPWGMQVEWETIKKLASTKAVDMWWLFPLGMGVLRLLDRDKMPTKAREKRLTKTFGNEDWKEKLYIKKKENTLFGVEEQIVRDADLETLKNYILEKLSSVFVRVAPNPLVLRNSRNAPLYLLCFAASNVKGAKTAVKIASHILGR